VWYAAKVAEKEDGRMAGDGALIVATGQGALAVVGGLPLVVRAVLALAEAGVTRVAVFAGPQRDRVAALLAARAPAVPCLATAEEAARLDWPDRVPILAGDVLVDAAGTAGAPTLHRDALPALLARPLAGGASLAEALRRAGCHAPGVPPADGLHAPLDPGHPPRVLETLLLDHLARRTVVADSYLAALVDRRLSRPVTRWLLRWPVTPAQITLASLVVGLAGAAGLATVSYAARLGGVLALVVSLVLDCVDGEVARARLEHSPTGARFDLIGDYVVHLAVFAGLATGLARQGVHPLTPWVAVALVTGVAAALVTVHALFIHPALARGGDLHWAGDGRSLRGTPLATVVEKLASRDYTYLLLVLAPFGRLEWFVYAAAAGSWVFVAGLLGHRAYARREARRPVSMASSPES
jgi:phosphatidylglycerophosphate synthase